MGKGGGVACERPVFELAGGGMGAGTSAVLPRRPAGRPKRPGPEAAAKRLAGPYLKKLLQRSPLALNVEVGGILTDNRHPFERSRECLEEVYMSLDSNLSTEDTFTLHQQVETRNAALLSSEHHRWFTTSFQVAECLAGSTLTPTQRVAVERAAAKAHEAGDLLPGVEQTLMLLKNCGTTVHPIAPRHLQQEVSTRFQRLLSINPTSHMATKAATPATIRVQAEGATNRIKLIVGAEEDTHYSDSFPETIEMLIRSTNQKD